jgi:hypothetical protein
MTDLRFMKKTDDDTIVSPELAGCQTVNIGHRSLVRVIRNAAFSVMPDVSTAPSRVDEALVKRAQLKFYVDGKAGCAFAALAAKTPEWYGWRQAVLPVETSIIQAATEQAIVDPKTSMISLIFPSVNDLQGLQTLITTLGKSGVFQLDHEKEHEGFRCIGLRARVGNLESWVSGFGPFDFFPATRQSPYSEIAFRVKARPDYKQFIKKAPEGVIHLADLDFFGDLSWAAFQTIWKATLTRTKEILGHEPDLRSAAKTTFAIPK